MKPSVITTGDFNGISPEIIIKALNKINPDKNKIILIGNSCIFEFYEKKYNLKLNQKYEIIEIPLKPDSIKLGYDTAESGDFSFKALKIACKMATEGKISSIITAPLSKNAMHLAGHNFSGQTEVLEKYLAHDEQKAEMLFTARDFRVMLLTRHVAISDLNRIITKELIIEKITRLNEELINKFKISCPKIALAALNPHASENGLFGSEESESFIPAIDILKIAGINIEGPFPADAMFARANDNYYDCFVATYHDQGLIPMKLIAGKYAVNTTIGLDVIRTSPAHGTAFDIAGKLIADETSMVAAIKSAI